MGEQRYSAIPKENNLSIAEDPCPEKYHQSDIKKGFSEVKAERGVEKR